MHIHIDTKNGGALKFQEVFPTLEAFTYHPYQIEPRGSETKHLM